MLANLPSEQYQRLRQIKREDAEAAVAFANTISKVRYNQAHRAIAASIKPGSMVYLRLHQRSKIPGLANRKLSNRVGPSKLSAKAYKHGD